MTLSSICDFFECFRMLAVPVPWRKWVILSKPIRQPVEGSTDSRGVDRRCGGNAPRDHPSEVRVERVCLALAVIRMGKLVGKLSMSKILYKKILGKSETHQTEKESVMSPAKTITMGIFR